MKVDCGHRSRTWKSGIMVQHISPFNPRKVPVLVLLNQISHTSSLLFYFATDSPRCSLRLSRKESQSQPPVSSCNFACVENTPPESTTFQQSGHGVPKGYPLQIPDHCCMLICAKWTRPCASSIRHSGQFQPDVRTWRTMSSVLDIFRDLA